ncbi:hypothetical protein FDO65_17120 [Nakamurella flava]|uniref:DUF4386 family protein n=1 Tax=Nakamurella flava TaxID=2576308 RepID=A0A4U6QD39_9ACTN|nr:hypothetical protein [Nakamurella flava]TKV57849.1 hypothetical protein FDO65_17120 [Nakamurella flava]
MTSTSSGPGSPVRSRPDAPPATAAGPPGAGVAGVVGALLLAVTNALVALNPVEDTAGLLRLLAERPGYGQVTVIVGLLAAVLLVPGIWAFTAQLRGRAPAWSAVGGWLMASGYVLSVALSADTATALSVAATGGDPAVYVDAVDNHTSAAAVVMYAGFGVGALAGGLILGIAMLRQQGAVPAWAGWALIACEPVRVAGLLLGVPWLPAVASMLIAAAFAGTVFAPRWGRRPGS